jgi:uncharacterized iron-regulated membrane protein/flavodoxin
VIGGAVIFIMSFTGFILTYEDRLVEYAGKPVRHVRPPAFASGRLSLDEVISRASEHNPGVRPTTVVLRNDPTASVAVGFGREGAIYVNPYTGSVLGRESTLHDWFHEIIDWHRWLGTEGEGRATGRAITGACNLAFFWLAVTGVYLWWPRSWRWRGLKQSLLFNPRLSGKARDWNWHNVIGLWSSAVLVILTLTAAVMSYGWANDLLYTLTGSQPPPRAQGPGQMAEAPQHGGDRERRDSPARFESSFARAQEQAPGWVTMTMRLPRGEGPLVVLIQESTAPHVFARSQLALDASTAQVIQWDPYAAASTGRKLRSWVRGLHTGEALGFAGQTIAGLASLGGCFLVWTGFAMAWRRFRYRNRMVEETLTGTALRHGAPTGDGGNPPIGVTGGPATVTPAEHDACRSLTARAGTTRPPGTEGDARAPVLVLYGTVTGNSETVAKKIAVRLGSAGFAARLRDMADCHPAVLNESDYALVVISTYGDGEPPDDAAKFYEAVTRGDGLDLRGLKFSVLGLGNTTYDQFCRCGKEIDTALERHGATRFYPRVDCDAEYESPAHRWAEGMLASLRSEYALTGRASETAPRRAS